MKRTIFTVILVLGVLLSSCTPIATPVPATQPVVQQTIATTPVPATQPVVQQTIATTPVPATQPVVQQTVAATPEPASATTPVTIELWVLDYSAKVKGIQDVSDAVHALYPNITIKLTVIPYDDYWTKVIAAVPTGTGPDVAMTWAGIIPNWVKSGIIVPLPDSVAKEVAANLISFTATKVNGKEYGVLTSVRNFQLAINTTLTEAAGIKTVPTTWEELAADAMKCTKTDAGGNITQAGFFLDWEEDGWNFHRPIIESYGGQWASDDGKTTLFNKSDGARAAWQFIVDLTIKDKVSSPSFFAGASLDSFAAALTCYNIFEPQDAGWLKTNMKPGYTFTIARMPAGPKGSFTGGTSWPLVLFAKSANDPVKLDAATKILMFMASAKGQELYSDSTLELPARKDMWSNPKYTSDPIMKIYMEGLPQTNGPFEADELAQKQCSVDMYNNVVLKNEDPMKALDEGAACDQAVRDKYFAK